jgi:1,4-dihydroxy-6-naphthoate synthase
MKTTRTPDPITVACTPGCGGAFTYYALEAGRLGLAGLRLAFRRAPVGELNRAALEGRYPITAISSVLYPQVARRYAILGVGASVGRGYGPALVSRHHDSLGELRNRRVGVAGMPTTGWFLLRWLCPDAVPVEMPYDRIGEAVAAGEIDAGVMIDEELLYYPELGLRRVADLGAEWCRYHGLPLPVGLNVVRRNLGAALMARLCDGIRQSLGIALEDRAGALARASEFGRGTAGGCTETYVKMFVNDDSVRMPDDVRRALPVLFARARELTGGRGEEVARPEIVDGSLALADVTHPQQHQPAAATTA